MHRGQYFTIDAFVSMMIVATTILLLFGLYSSAPETEQPRLISQELVSILADTKVNELNSPFIKANIGDGNITNLDYTILQQAAEFYLFEDTRYNNANLSALLIQNVSAAVPPQFNFHVAFGTTTKDIIYQRGSGLAESELAISSRRVVFGVDEATQELWGPIVAEVVVWQ